MSGRLLRSQFISLNTFHQMENYTKIKAAGRQQKHTKIVLANKCSQSLTPLNHSCSCYCSSPSVQSTLPHFPPLSLWVYLCVSTLLRECSYLHTFYLPPEVCHPLHFWCPLLIWSFPHTHTPLPLLHRLIPSHPCSDSVSAIRVMPLIVDQVKFVSPHFKAMLC